MFKKLKDLTVSKRELYDTEFTLTYFMGMEVWWLNSWRYWRGKRGLSRKAALRIIIAEESKSAKKAFFGRKW